MGLAEPRKRLKISHDPNNLAWSQSENSYGQRLMISQGWKAGQGLGSKTAQSYGSLESARVTVSYKDDTLGLGAKLKSKDIEHSRTGLDAFQGLLGRLNGKLDFELEKEAKKIEDRRLAMWAQGRWGGMIFVPGGLLVQGDKFKPQQEESDFEESVNGKGNLLQTAEDQLRGSPVAQENDRAVKKDEKRRRKEESRGGRAAKFRAVEETGSALDRQKSDEKVYSKEKRQKKRERSARDEDPSSAVVSASETDSTDASKTPPIAGKKSVATLPNGRHILRGRNIQAKKLAFADAKMLDEIFMRQT